MKIELSSIIENQFPTYVREEYPLAIEFLKQYYISDNGNKIVQNLEDYLDLDVFFNLNDNSILSQSVDLDDDIIEVDSTEGFSDTYGLLKINNEIITYKSKTQTSFEGCVRGFSGIDTINQNELIFTQTEKETHEEGASVENLSILFLKIFFLKIKQKIAPGFENRDFYSEVNQSNFLKRIHDFYSSKGTAESFRILFGALYGEDVKLLLPRDQLFAPSDADYRIVKKLNVEALEGNPFELINSSIYQDTDGFVPEARGTVTYVEKIRRNNTDYYLISLDFGYDRDINVSGTLKSDFIIHPKTLTTNDIFPGSTFIDVDSTAGFPESGTVVVKTSNNTDLVVTYTFKTFNQFLGCSNISQQIISGTSVRYDTYAYGYSPSQEIIKLRITGVLSTIKFIDENYLYKPGENINIETLGTNSNKLELNTWKFNIPLIYNIDSFLLKDQTNLLYEIKTIDEHIFSVGDNVSLISSSNQKTSGEILSILNNNTVIVSLNEILTENFYKIRKEISKVNFFGKPELNIYNANIQNTFIDYEKNSYVLSPSLPSYLNTELNPNTSKITVSGIFTNEITIVDNPFYTGESVVYKSLILGSPIKDGVYFIKRDGNVIKLATSRENIYRDEFLTFTNANLSCTIELFDFTNSDLSSKNIAPQNLIRKLPTPKSAEEKDVTPFGAIGIFNNGVELLNYKSNQQIFYGPIENVIVSANGDNYDIINPPDILIYHETGQDALIYPTVKGNLKRIDLVDSGFDYIDEPEIFIKGGNGVNAKAKANLVTIEHIEQFNAATSINVTNDVIGFSTYHKFRNNEQIIYDSNTQQTIGGLTNNEKYFINVKSPTSISLHSNLNDSVLGINSINLTAVGVGNHIIKAVERKNIISSISVINSGENYLNRKNYISGINTANNVIEVKNHNFKDGEIVFYVSSETPSSGLSNNTEYYVKIIDKDHVRLSGISSSTPQDFLYKTNTFIGISSVNSSQQYLSYPPITVEVKGRIGVATFSNEDYTAKIIPVFRGSIIDTTLEKGGRNYGSEEIINYNNQPNFNITKGSGAKLLPIISDGRIKEVIILSPGDNYISHPDIIVNGDGFNAILTPIIVNNKIQEIKVISGGFNYTEEKTELIVISSGEGAKFEAKIKSWRINLFEKYNSFNYFKLDDGIVSNSNRFNSGLQYYHIFAARELRKSTFSKKLVNENIIYEPDLILDDAGKEINSLNHSPIIGWAYDGNPIYGPYGYSNSDGSSLVKQLQSGYSLKSESLLSFENRPSPNIFKFGFFIEDYEYIESDLDYHNGRYGITPEFPNGVYAYFATFENEISSLEFNNYKKPKFPYVIGNSFYSSPIDFNFDPKSNQDDINLNELDLIRNTRPYNLNSNNTLYESIILPYQIKKEIINVKSSEQDKVDEITPIIPGNFYKVGDKIIVENDNKAEVFSVRGKSIENVVLNTKIIENVELLSKDDNIIGFCTVPHELENNTQIYFSTYDNKKDSKNVKIENNSLTLSSDVPNASTTGIVTFFNVYGNISKNKIKANDIYKIGNELLKIINVDNLNSRLKVVRMYNGTIGVQSHQSGSTINELSKRIILSNTLNIVSKKENIEVYFNSKESVAVGLSAGIGIVSTIYFNNPGIGITFLALPTRQLYLPMHGLETNDILIYNNYDNAEISISTNGITTSNLSEINELYAYKFDENIIGISSGLTGVGSTGQVFNTNNNTGLLYFASAGLGTYHSFITNFKPVKADIIKKDIIITTDSNHNLLINDNIKLNHISGVTTSVKFIYNDILKRILSKEAEIIEVDTENNILRFSYHNFKDGEKVVYVNSGQNINGLINNSIFYVIKINDYKIKLANTYDANYNFNEISLESDGDGSIFSINPYIELTKNSIVEFDLSDSSLGYVRNNQVVPAFNFNLYYNKNFTDLYFNNQSSPVNNFTKSGVIGNGSNAKATLVLDDFTPQKLYYNFVPINDGNTPASKIEKIDDFDQINNNSVALNESKLNKNYKIKKVTNTTFNISPDNSVSEQINISTDIVNYETTSLSSNGGISKIKITKNNPNNKVLPEILDVISESGDAAILISTSEKIGKINSVFLSDIGFEYSSDLSLRPKLNLPKIIKVQPLFTINTIDVISSGINYFIKPELILIDNATQSIVEDVVFNFIPDKKLLTIVKNTEKLEGNTPYIIPINNSSGFSINDIIFNESTKDVVVILETEFSNINDFPFVNGDKVIIENVLVNEGEQGYNSNLYNYKLFEIRDVDPKIGGIGASFTYNMSEFLNEDENLGLYNKDFIKGTVTPEKYFPVFKINLKRNNFILGENVFNNEDIVGVIEDENFSNNYIKVLTNNNLLSVGDILVGQSSKVSVITKEIIEFNAYMEIKSSSILEEGWKKETGFFNTNSQRLHDNDYYQNFSYSLLSEVSFSEWNDVVSKLNHPSGFKKFSDLVVYSESTGISTVAENEVNIFNDIETDVDMNCINNFDLVRENSFIINNKLTSSEIYFENTNNLQDYIEVINNRVLDIDTVVVDFSADNGIKDFISLDSNNVNDYYYKKYFISVVNKWYPEKSSIVVVTNLNNEETTLVNQYADISSEETLGYFDSNLTDNDIELRFYPNDYEYSSYYINHLSFNVGKEYLGFSTVSLGNVAHIQYSGITTSSGVGTTTILDLPSTVSAAKVLVGIKIDANDYCEFSEITILNNNNNISFSDYGNLSISNTNGIGTYGVYYSSGKILLNFTPNDNFGNYNANIISNVIFNTSLTGIGSTSIENNYINSSEVTTNLGVTTEIFRYSNENSGAYSIIYIENPTDSIVSEFISLYNPITNDVNHVEYGNIATDNTLGIITSYFINNEIVTYFIPKDNLEYKIRSINNVLGTFQNKKKTIINESFDFNANFNFYEAALFGTKKEIELLHQGEPIFNKEFDGSDTDIIDVVTDTINIPNHFFVTGEEVKYTYDESPIEITPTLIGVAVTDKLPQQLFVVKVNETSIRVSAAASLALLPSPQTLGINSVGIGTVHKLSSKLQNNRSIIVVDNLIQNSLGLTTVSTSLAKSINFYDSNIILNNIDNIKSNDLLKINDEIIKVISVGVGSTNGCFVDRAKLGTSLEKHQQSDQINKIICDYNIIDNKIQYEAIPFVSNVEDEYKYTYTFTGRVFLRSGALNSINPTYFDNYIFDDISPQFNGIKKSFILKENGNSVTDISQDNIFVAINNIFQTPQTNYSLQESGGETSLNFIGESTGSVYDVNTATIPRGGIIISVGSSQGFGYQPLVSAAGTAIVSTAGTILSVSIGNSGSGYRQILQTVNVGIQTEGTGNYNIQFIGTATVSGGYVNGVTITNPGVGFTEYPIKYETNTTSIVSIGATIIPIDYISGITTNSFISVGAAITNAPIVGVGSTSIIISNSFAPSVSISDGTLTKIKDYFPPIVIFDGPLSYSNLPLKYVNGTTGFGTEATVSIVVGQGSSVIDFEINNFGYGYNLNDELTVDIGGVAGIPTDISKPFSPFKLKVTDIFNDKITATRLGELQLFDSFDKFFNGTRKTFQLRISNIPTGIVKKPGSNFNLANNLLIFINDTLQIPGESYVFVKGSTVTFLEPPQQGDKSKIILYKGTRDIDTIEVDVIEEVEPGDIVTINSDTLEFKQNPRVVFEITSPDSLSTYAYSEFGISDDDSLIRPIDICRLTYDIIIDGKIVSKDRVYYEPIITPTTRLISNVSTASTEIFVENLRAFFDNKDEYLITEPQNKNIKIISTSDNVKYEEIENVTYGGDYGYISGIKTTNIGIGSTGIIFQFYIPQKSILRTENYVENGLSGINSGYYFKVSDSNLGNSIISLNNDETQVGVGTTFIDNVYKAYSVSIAQTSVLGVGLTDVVEVTSKVDRYITGVGISGFYGNFSWGRIHSFIRKNPKEFLITPSGITTSPVVQRTQPIKYENYSN